MRSIARFPVLNRTDGDDVALRINDTIHAPSRDADISRQMNEEFDADIAMEPARMTNTATLSRIVMHVGCDINADQRAERSAILD
jgi:hypothetical protein